MPTLNRALEILDKALVECEQERTNIIRLMSQLAVSLTEQEERIKQYHRAREVLLKDADMTQE